jgi:lipopolysaccharide/colanic/teichoic acid biosynthesis glycosyltransferase
MVAIRAPWTAAYVREYRTKRALDLVLCALAIPIALPLSAIVALLIRLDTPGPIFIRQTRTGRNGSTFHMYKFRTMVQNAEELKASLMHLNVLTPPDFKIPNDPRITRVGRFLRRTSLDEVPQIFNILRGEMSWVGPRPTTFKPSTYAVWHGARLEMRPGLTGLWQVKVRHSSTFDERVRLDVQYLHTASLLTDLKILALTVLVVLRRTGA